MGVTIRSFGNQKEEPFSRDEVRAVAARVGGVEKLFSKRAMKYQQMGLHEQQLTEDDLLRLMTEAGGCADCGLTTGAEPHLSIRRAVSLQ